METLLLLQGLYIQAYLYGGPVALTWGWVTVCVFTSTVALSMAEICSSFPVSGGLYFWSFALGGKAGPHLVLDYWLAQPVGPGCIRSWQ